MGFLGKMQQRRMCSFDRYGMPEMVVTGSFLKEMWAVDMSPELDAYYLEQEQRQKEVNSGWLMKQSKSVSVDLGEDDSRGSVEHNRYSQGDQRDIGSMDALHNKSY